MNPGIDTIRIQRQLDDARIGIIRTDITAAAVYLDAVAEHRRNGNTGLAEAALMKADASCVSATRMIMEIVASVPDEVAVLDARLGELRTRLAEARGTTRMEVA
jgi:hypothetical protein